jgi:Fe-S-cluster containining protein
MSEFTRTTCACDRCRACCKRQPGAFAHGEVERLVEHVMEKQNCDREIAFQTVKAQIWASPGALVKDLSTGQTQRIGSITPRYRHGRCVFLDENERCTIHAVAPFGCAMFDTHMDSLTAHPRSVHLALSHKHPDYQRLRASLPMASHYKPNRY